MAGFDQVVITLIKQGLPRPRLAWAQRGWRIENAARPGYAGRYGTGLLKIRMEENVLGVNRVIITPIDLGAALTGNARIGPQAAGKRREVGLAATADNPSIETQDYLTLAVSAYPDNRAMRSMRASVRAWAWRGPGATSAGPSFTCTVQPRSRGS